MNRKLQNLIDRDAYDPAGNYDDMIDGAGNPRPGDEPEVVVLTPVIYNSAYCERSYLDRCMGAELVAARPCAGPGNWTS